VSENSVYVHGFYYAGRVIGKRNVTVWRPSFRLSVCAVYF